MNQKEHKTKRIVSNYLEVKHMVMSRGCKTVLLNTDFVWCLWALLVVYSIILLSILIKKKTIHM